MPLNHHEPDCAYQAHPSPAKEQEGHVDSFCGCHAFPEPRILADKTSIAWPAGWSQAEADVWRVAHNLARPLTRLENIGQGTVNLVTEDQAMIERAMRGKETVETFFYWTGEEMQSVTGAVSTASRDGRILRFTVVPEEPGAHAI